MRIRDLHGAALHFDKAHSLGQASARLHLLCHVSKAACYAASGKPSGVLQEAWLAACAPAASLLRFRKPA